MSGAAGGDHGCDPDGPDLLAVDVVVVTPVRVEPVGSAAGSSASAMDWRDGVDQGHEVGDVVAVSSGQCDCQGYAVRFGDQMVLGACSGTVDRARSGFGPPFMART